MASKKEKIENKVDAFFSTFSTNDEKISFKFGNQILGEKLPVISTGSYALDDALSSGGLPKGRIVQYYGAPSSSKSLMAMLGLKEAQKENPKALQLWIDAEQTFSVDWAMQLGIDVSKVVIVDGDDAANGRKCFEMLLGVPKEDPKTHALKGKSKEGFFDKVANGELNFNMVVLDSIGQIIVPGEDTSYVGKINMAKQAQFFTGVFKKISLEIAHAQIPFIVINHKKDSLDQWSGSDHRSSGGNTYFHSLSANIYFEPSGGRAGQILDASDNRIGTLLRATVEKSKFGPFPRKCEFKVIFTQGIISSHEEIAELALKYEVATKPSAQMIEYKENKWRGKDAFANAISENESLKKELLVEIEKARDTAWEKQRTEQQKRKQELELEDIEEESVEEVENE
jgi:recombination protein RecA